MKRLITAVLLVMLCALSLGNAFAAQQLPAVDTLRVNAHLRAGPSTETESKMILMKGATVTVLSVEGRWLYVHYGNFSGYIRADMVVGNVPALEDITPADIIVTDGGDRTVLKHGMRGETVRNLQNALISLGYDLGTADGMYGDSTEAAVIRLQQDYGIPADGIVGKETYDILSYALSWYDATVF